MTKIKRYFDEDPEKTTSPEAVKTKFKKKNTSFNKTEAHEIIKYNVKIRKKVWGRKHEEKETAKKIKKQKKIKIDPKLLKKHSRGIGLNKTGVKMSMHKKRFSEKEENIKFANEQAARTEMLLTEEVGFLEADDGETTTQFTQKQIAESVDISSATKHFELKLNDFGPYRMRYTRNGRHLLLGGKMGHVAAFDWVTKKLHCELNVMETVHDVAWLHIETMFAVAQKDYVYIYDNQGIELHCVKRLNKVSRMEFLPYHFLLSSASEEGYISWLDISIGELVSRFNTNFGRLSVMTQNPYNAVVCLGHAKGIVSMWSPNSHKPLAKMLCHKSPLTSIHVDPKGMYMATTAVNREVKIWDIRKLEGPMQTYKIPSVANNLNFSHKNMLAIGMGNILEVYKDCCTTAAKRPYLRHRFNNTIGNFNFCPYEDVLGVATAKGFTSLLVPGAGEANFDGFEANPYQTKSQRREAEVKSLLEKIQPDLITLDPTIIAEIDVPTLRDKIEMKTKLLHLKPPKIDYTPRNKAKGKGGSVKMARNRKIVQETAKKEFIRSMKDVRDEPPRVDKKSLRKTGGVLDRFLPK